jgi:hypothetical protein
MLVFQAGQHLPLRFTERDAYPHLQPVERDRMIFAHQCETRGLDLRPFAPDPGRRCS